MKYYICSRSDSVQAFNGDVRSHRGIEKKLHWNYGRNL